MAITELEELAVIDLGGGNCVRIVLNDASGKTVVDIRRWYTDDEEELRPTGKGVMVPAKHVDTVAEVFSGAADHPKVKDAIAVAEAAKAAKTTTATKKAPAKKAAATKKAAPKRAPGKRAAR